MNGVILCLSAIAGLVVNDGNEGERGEPVLRLYGFGLQAVYGIVVMALPLSRSRLLALGITGLTVLLALFEYFLITARLD
jgi:hypothetical protein